MPDGNDTIIVRRASSILEVPAADWDACAGDDAPFCRHAFLAALEQSGSATAATGWDPRHLLAEDGTGRLVACAPLYRKNHSYGEYVFDWTWADAWRRAGRAYYPKLQCAVPFTPVGGRRLLVRPGLDAVGAEQALATAMVQQVEAERLSSAHITFLSEGEARRLAARGWLLRMGQQFHWTNEGYESFDDFLGALSSRKRKAIRKERERAQADGLGIHTLTGADITPGHWDAFFAFYRATSDRKWGNPYLTRRFFHRLGETMADRVVLIMAEQHGRWVAGALNMLGGDTLYGRNWGALGDFPFLHFEMCYYRAIDFAIARGLARVEAGAQGEHKLSRGYLPTPTWSVHWIREQPLRRAVAHFLDEERLMVAETIDDLGTLSPYRDDD
jgi:uncharacterized protein